MTVNSSSNTNINSGVVASPVTQQDREHEINKMGYIQKLFGSNEHTNAYLSAVAIICTGIATAVLVGFKVIPNQSWTAIIALVSAYIGYLFGSK